MAFITVSLIKHSMYIHRSDLALFPKVGKLTTNYVHIVKVVRAETIIHRAVCAMSRVYTLVVRTHTHLQLLVFSQCDHTYIAH